MIISCQICQRKKVIKSYKIGKWQYFFCKNCQTLFLNPKPEKKTIQSFYTKQYKQEAAIQREAELRNRSKIILRMFKKLNPKGKLLLDVGSGYGFFLDEAKKLNYKIFGIEPARYLYQFSKNKLKLPIANITFEEYFKKHKAKKFDFVTLIHVIEHLNQPETIIKMIGQILNKNGVLYIETPNLDSYLFYSEKQNYTFLTPPDHIFIFSQKSFKFLIPITKNLKIERISTYSYPEHFAGILKRTIKQNILTTSVHSDKKLDKTSECVQNNYSSLIKKIKFLLFDQTISPLFYKLLNIGYKGSILELYIRKLT